MAKIEIVIKIILIITITYLPMKLKCDDEDVTLIKPLCKYLDLNDTNKETFEEFAKQEECLFQLFMDNLIVLDCWMNMTKGIDKVFDVRHDIYAKGQNYLCKCKEVKNDENKSGIETLDEYVDCWDNYWRKMTEILQSEIDKITPSDPNFESCKNQLQHKHDDRC